MFKVEVHRMVHLVRKHPPLHPYQRGFADAIADPRIERVSVLKSARVGFTTLLVGAIAHYIVPEPSPVLVLMPTESDARGLMVDDIEGLFAESPAVADLVGHCPRDQVPDFTDNMRAYDPA
jgi:phage terminase large subunit GpA-like protein